MLKVKRTGGTQQLINVEDMECLQIGIVQEGKYHNNIVMRNQSPDKFELINLSNPIPGYCWSDTPPPFKVRLLSKNEPLTLIQDLEQ